MRKAKLGIRVIALVLLSAGLGAGLSAGAAHATAAGTLWNLSGVATARVGQVSESVPVTGMLALNNDRTYMFQINGEPVADMGAWFELKGKLLLYTQNLLEAVTELEDEIAMEVGQPAEVTPVKSKSRVSISATTGLLSIRSDTAYQVYLPMSGLTLRFTVRLMLTGTEV